MLVRTALIQFACLALLTTCLPVTAQTAETTASLAPADTTDKTAVQTQAVAAATTTSAAELTPAVLEARIKDIQGNAALDGDQKKAVLDLLQQALVSLKAADTWKGKADTSAKTTELAPARIAALKQALSAPAEARLPDLPETATAAMITQMADRAEAELATLTRQASDLRSEQGTHSGRRAEIPKLIAAANQAIDQINKDNVTPTAPSEPAEVTAARAAFHQTRRRALQAEIEAHEKELAAQDATAELATLEADRLTNDIAVGERAVTRLRDAIHEKRRNEAGEAVREAQRVRMEAANLHPAIRQLAEQNEQLAERRTGPEGLAERIKSTEKSLDETRRTLTRLETRIGQLKKRVEATGNTHAVGQLLRKSLGELPDVNELRRQSASHATAIVQAQTDLIDLEDSRTELADLATQTSHTLATAGLELSSDEIEQTVRDLLRTRRTLVESLIADTNTWFGKLIDVDTVEQQLIVQADAAAEYIGERILYVQSAPPLGMGDFHRGAQLLRLILSQAFWSDVMGTLAKDARQRPGLYLPILVLFPCAFYYRRRLKQRLRVNGEMVLQDGLKTAAQSVGALVLTMLIALPAVALMGFLGWQLRDAPGNLNAQAMGAGLITSAKYAYLLLSIYHICAPLGIAEAHFRWPKPQLRILVRELRWFVPLTVACSFLLNMAARLATATQNEAPGRILGLVYMASLSLAFYRVLHPAKGALSVWLAAGKGGWIERTRYLWFGAIVALPFVFMGIAGVGYYYTAARLLARFMLSMFIVFFAVIINGLFAQWIVIGRRNLAMLEARRRAMAIHEPETGEAGAQLEEEAVDVAAISSQARRVLAMLVGASTILLLYMINVEVLPALRRLDTVELWSYTGKITETLKAPDGTVRTQMVEKLIPVTLGGLLFALVALSLTISATRNAPGLLEMVIYQRVALDSGLRYALTTITTYVIMVVGMLITLSMVGVTWSSVQWLAAAISVGLGFGLQEIFANFISGLIILFERPIRVGDTITIGEMSGTVTRIHIRATTIRGWDGKDLLVPNKLIITGNVVNWTLSDTITRLDFNVTADLGSDPERVREILADVASLHPKVLKEPPPVALFNGFGGGSLEFKLFCYVAVMADRGPTITEINVAVLRRLGEAGIQIALPVRPIQVMPGEKPGQKSEPKGN